MTDRRAPVQAGEWTRDPAKRRPAGTVPWDVHLRAWQVYAEHGYGSQSAERVAERAGFGYEEMQCLLAGHNPFRGPYPCSLAAEHEPVPGWLPRRPRA